MSSLRFVLLLGSALLCQVWCIMTAYSAEPKHPPAVVFDGLWSHSRPVTTCEPAAQRFFDQGLGFLYAFNHDEAIRSFAEASRLDSHAAMPQWGIAYANGPHINYPLVDAPHAEAAWAALRRAQELAATASPVEQELIAALAQRYASPQPEDRAPLDRAYADAMRKVWQRHPGDADIGALYAESLMDLRPWDQWSADGTPQPETEEVLSTLKAVLALDAEHPLGLHLYIHAIEASPRPDLAEAAADTLRRLPLKLGHLVHMPSHIDVRLGHWKQAIVANERAIAADAAYRQAVPEQGFYRTYMAHNHHMLAFAAMMRGQSRQATDAIQNLMAEIPPAWLQENGLLVDAFFAMPYEMHLRFGRWDQMLAEPEPAEVLPVSRAVRLYARGIAFTAQGKIVAARAEQAAFRHAVAALPEEAIFVLNPAADVLAVAELVLEGEILYREGRVDEAVESLRTAVQREAALRYIEPPDWIQPSRHVLGATLSDAGRWVEAEAVYREDLRANPHNGWSLYGLAQSLRRQGRAVEADAADAQFRTAWSDADVRISSSCLCLPGRE